MPLLKGKSEIGHNVTEMEKAGHPRAQAVAAALKTANVPKAKDDGLVTSANSAIPSRSRTADDGSFSATDAWKGRRG